MYDICCVGHITSDKVVNTKTVQYIPGGTALYFSIALSRFNLNYLLVTALAKAEQHYVTAMQNQGIKIEAHNSLNTVYFENIYGENQDDRTQRVLQTADSFTVEQLSNVNAKIFHLGPLLHNDIPLLLIKDLSQRGKVSLDVQGYLRKVENQNVYATDWPEKIEALQYVDILKADVAELKALTGNSNVEQGAKIVADWGVKEVIVTNGSQGSVIYSEGVFYVINAYPPTAVVDATGCGDTYMAGYLYQRTKGASIPQSGNFAAAMAGLKTNNIGPFTGTEADVDALISGSI